MLDLVLEWLFDLFSSAGETVVEAGSALADGGVDGVTDMVADSGAADAVSDAAGSSVDSAGVAEPIFSGSGTISSGSWVPTEDPTNLTVGHDGQGSTSTADFNTGDTPWQQQ